MLKESNHFWFSKRIWLLKNIKDNKTPDARAPTKSSRLHQYKNVSELLSTSQTDQQSPTFVFSTATNVAPTLSDRNNV